MKSMRRNLRPEGEGKLFEKQLLDQAWAEGFTIVRMPTGARAVGSTMGKPRLIPVKTPFDFVLVRRGQCIFVDAKSNAQGTFNQTKITHHQAVALRSLQNSGVRAGYIINFRKHDAVVFFDASVLVDVMTDVLKKSLRVQDGHLLGTSRKFLIGWVLDEGGVKNEAVQTR